jgi:hypothetical protein
VTVVSANADDQQDHSCVSHLTLVPSLLKDDSHVIYNRTAQSALCQARPDLGSTGISISKWLRSSGGHGSSDAVGVMPNTSPLGAPHQDDEGDRRVRRLFWWRMRRSVVTSTSNSVSSARVQERTIAEGVPALGLRRVDGVFRQRADQPLRRAVVKEDEHRRERTGRAGSQPRSRALL